MVRRLIRTAVVLLLACGQAQAPVGLLQFSSGVDPVAAATCNIVTGVVTGLGAGGAGTCVTNNASICNGSNNDTAQFNAFNTWAVNTWQMAHSGLLELDIPHNGVCTFSGGGNAIIACGISQLRIVGLGFSGQGDGAEFTDASGAGGYALGACGRAYGRYSGGSNLTGGICYIGIYETTGAPSFLDGCSSRVTGATAGATCVNLITGDSAQTPTYLAGRFPAAVTKIVIGGLDIQGYGAPQNNFWHEYVTPTSVSSSLQCDGVTSGASVHFTPALQYTYQSNWPLYNNGASGAGTPDQGGPATIWAMNPTWDASIELRGLYLNACGQQPLNVRSVTWRNTKADGLVAGCGSGGGNCFFPSQNQNWTVINSDWSACHLEMDKIVTNVTIDDTVVHVMDFQSGYAQTVTIKNSSNIQIGLNGTPGHLVCTNSTIGGMTMGPTGFGASSTFVGNGCTFSNVLSAMGFAWPTNIYSMSGGVITGAHPTAGTAVGAGTAGVVRLTLTCFTIYPGCTPTQNMFNGMTTNLGNSCSTDAPLGNYTINVIDGTHIDLVGTTFTGASFAASCFTQQTPNSFTQYGVDWAVPGMNILWQGIDSEYFPGTQITGITDDVNGVYITTTLAGGFPNVPVNPPTSIRMVQSHYMPSWTCNNCAGISQWANQPAGTPWGSYYQATLPATPGPAGSPLFGTVNSILFHVTTLAGGGETVDLAGMGTPFWLNAAGTARVSQNVSESMSTVHDCTVTATTNVGCTSASSLGSALWALSSQIEPRLVTGSSGSVTVTIQTNQGVVAGP